MRFPARISVCINLQPACTACQAAARPIAGGAAARPSLAPICTGLGLGLGFRDPYRWYGSMPITLPIDQNILAKSGIAVSLALTFEIDNFHIPLHIARHSPRFPRFSTLLRFYASTLTKPGVHSPARAASAVLGHRKPGGPKYWRRPSGMLSHTPPPPPTAAMAPRPAMALPDRPDARVESQPGPGTEPGGWEAPGRREAAEDAGARAAEVPRPRLGLFRGTGDAASDSDATPGTRCVLSAAGRRPGRWWPRLGSVPGRLGNNSATTSAWLDAQAASSAGVPGPSFRPGAVETVALGLVACGLYALRRWYRRRRRHEGQGSFDYASLIDACRVPATGRDAARDGPLPLAGLKLIISDL